MQKSNSTSIVYRLTTLFFIVILTWSILIGSNSASMVYASQTIVEASELDVESDIKSAIFEAIADHADVLGFIVFDVLVDEIEISESGSWATSRLVYIDKITSEIVPAEPGLALAERTGNTWLITLQDDTRWNFVLSDVPNDLLSDEEKAYWRLEVTSEVSALQVFGGYKLPWTGGESHALYRSITHSSAEQYAFDFGENGNQFELRASKGGVVWFAQWTYPDGYSDGDCNHANYIVIKDTSTSPETFVIYLHLKQDSIPSSLRTRNTPVVQGQVIGVADDTGCSTASHVHIQVHTNPNSWYGTSQDMTFDDVSINGGRPRTPAEATAYGGQGQTWYTSGNYGGCEATSIPSGYSKCAEEGGGNWCNFSGLKTVYFGANSCFAVEQKTDRVECVNESFGGDPLPGVHKACYTDGGTPMGSWTARYFSGQDHWWDNNNFNNQMCQEIINSSGLDKNYGSSAPCNNGVNDNWVAEYNANIIFASGNYVFQAQNDDGLKMWVNGTNILERGGSQGLSYICPARPLSGSVPIRAILREEGGDARVKIAWTTDTSICDLPGNFDKTGPSNGATNQPLNPVITWTSSNRANDYSYCIDTTNNNNCDGNWQGIGNVTSKSLTGLTAGTTYYWHVRSHSEGGQTYSNGNTWWSFTTMTNTPNPPTPISPLTGHNFNEGESINLSWSATGSEYFGEISGGPGGTLSFGWQTATSKNIGSQWAGYTYTWRVKARNGTNESGWSFAHVFIVRPAAPTNLNASVASCNQINLSWNDNSGSEEGYRVYRDGGLVASLPSGATSYQNTGLSQNTSYSYYVVANRGSVESNASNTASITTSTCGAGIPTLISPTDGQTFNEGDAINLSWSSTGNEYFGEISGGPGGTLTFGWQTSAAKNIGSQWAGYAYSWRVKARNGSGESGWSSTRTFIVRPGTPGNLSATATSCSQINLSWSDNSGNEEGYKIFRNGNLIATLPSGTTSYQDTGLGASTSYSYTVKAYRGTIESNASNTASGTTTVCTPDNFNKISPANGSINQPTNPTLTWQTSAGATSYEYCYDTTNNNSCSNWTSNGTSTSKVLSGLTANTNYYWHVRAMNSGGTKYSNGGATAFWSFKTQPSGTGIGCGDVQFNGIVLYENKYCNQDVGGVSKQFTTPTAWIDVVSDPIHDKASSIYVKPGWSIKVYEAATFDSNGMSWRCITGSMWDLSLDYYTNGNTGQVIDDTISSVRVYDNTNCTEVSPPLVFHKSSPSNGASGQPANPTLTWSPSNSATSYEYCYDTSDDNSCSTWISNGTSTSKTLSGLSANTSYYWHVRANNEGGTTYSNGSSTAFWSFHTGGTPGPFSKLGPPPASVNPNNATLNWSSSANATLYEYCYDTTGSGICSQWIGNGTSTSKTLTSLNQNTLYYWHVRASNSFGVVYSDGDQSAWTTFRTSGVPVAFNKSSPANGAVNQPLTLTLLWDDSSNATRYEYCYDMSGDNACSNWMSNGTFTSKTISGLNENTTYFWHVRAINSFGTTYANGDSTAFWSFTTQAPSFNLLLNSGFEEGSSVPIWWEKNAWSLPNSTFTWDATQKHSGKRSIKIANNSVNDARWIQTVQVQPNSNYRLSGWIKTQNVGYTEEFNDLGANISTLSPFLTSSSGLFGTNDWTFISYEFHTGDQTEVTIAARVGTYSGTITGTAWFDDLKLELLSTPECYTLTTGVTGSGSITINPGANCNGGTQYIHGTVVKLTGIPSPGFVFGGWSGDVSGSDNPVYVTMTANKSVTANFATIPTQPRLLAPANKSRTPEEEILFQWEGQSPVPHHHEIQVAVTKNFDQTKYLVTSTTTGTSYQFDLNPGTDYFWRVRAFNEFNQPGDWSETWTVETGWKPPTLISACDNEDIPNVRPAFRWSNLYGGSLLTLQISQKSNFAGLVLNTTVTGISYNPTKDLKANTQYYWRMRANGNNGPSAWSAYCEFTTGNPATVPALVAPTNNALVKDYTPLLNWNNSKLPAGTIFKYYEVQLDEDAGFAAPDTYTTTLNDITDSDFTSSSDLASNTKYYWRVRAVNVVNGVDHYSSWSTARSFRTVLAPPTGLTVTPNTLQPTFEWDDATGPEAIKNYTIQVSANASFKGLLLNITTQSSSYAAIKNLPPGKVMYWRVRVNGANGPSDWTAVQFTTP